MYLSSRMKVFLKNNEKNIVVKDLFDRIKQVLNVKTYAAVFRKLDMPRTDFDNWNSRGIPEAKVIILADKLNVTKEWLAFGEGPIENNIVQEADGLYKQADQVSIPYHKEVYASAGGGSDATNMLNTSPISFSRSFLNSFLGVYNVNGLSIINASGNSMEPTIKSGELMFVYPINGEEFKDGGVYVLMCSDKLLVKRVTFNPLTKEYTLVSDNGNVDPVTLTIDEGDDCRFVGRVVGHLDRV